MTIKEVLNNLHPSHEVVKAAEAMVEAHKEHDTLFSAIESIEENYPNVPWEWLGLIWIGINVKDRSMK